MTSDEINRRLNKLSRVSRIPATTIWRDTVRMMQRHGWDGEQVLADLDARIQADTHRAHRRMLGRERDV